MKKTHYIKVQTPREEVIGPKRPTPKDQTAAGIWKTRVYQVISFKYIYIYIYAIYIYMGPSWNGGTPKTPQNDAL